MLRTRRLILRPLEAGDADWITPGISLPEVHRWLTAVPRPYARADAVHFLSRHADDPTARAVVFQDRPCGVITVTLGRDETGLPELGYWLAKEAWGQGVMTEAARAMVAQHFAQSETSLGSGWIDGNTGSERVLAKTGFERTGLTVQRMSKYYGRTVPIVRVALTADRWRAVEIEGGGA